MTPSMALLDSPERLASALPGLRRRLLERLREPASASQLARELGVPRQKINYHTRALEAQELVELVELRRRRGFTERVLRTVGDGLVVDPAVLGALGGARAPRTGRAGSRILQRDRHAAEHLVEVAGAAVRDVARMSAAAGQGSTRLLTFTLETTVRLAHPADVHRYADELAAAIAGVTARFDGAQGRPYRVFAAGHPAPAPQRPTGDETPHGLAPVELEQQSGKQPE